MTDPSNSKPHILLLGCGYTLKKLATMLEQDTFIATAKRQESFADIHSKFSNCVTLDVTNSDQISQLLAKNPSLRIVVDSVPPTPNNKFPELLELTKVERVFYLSTTGVYGAKDGSWVDEESPTVPLHKKGVERLEVERRYHSQPSVQATTLRLPAIYGPGRAGLAAAIASGRFKTPRFGNSWSNRIHVDDLASILMALVMRPLTLPIPKVFCVSDGNPALYSEVVEEYCAYFKLPTPDSISEDRVNELKMTHFMSNQRVSNKKLIDFLGIQLKYPSFRQGLVTEDDPLCHVK